MRACVSGGMCGAMVRRTIQLILSQPEMIHYQEGRMNDDQLQLGGGEKEKWFLSDKAHSFGPPSTWNTRAPPVNLLVPHRLAPYINKFIDVTNHILAELNQVVHSGKRQSETEKLPLRSVWVSFLGNKKRFINWFSVIGNILGQRFLTNGSKLTGD